MPTSNPVSKLFTFSLTSAVAIVSIMHRASQRRPAMHWQLRLSCQFFPFSLSVFLSQLFQSFSCCLPSLTAAAACTARWWEAAGDHALRGGNNQLLSTEASCCCC